MVVAALKVSAQYGGSILTFVSKILTFFLETVVLSSEYSLNVGILLLPCKLMLWHLHQIFLFVTVATQKHKGFHLFQNFSNSCYLVSVLYAVLQDPVFPL